MSISVYLNCGSSVMENRFSWQINYPNSYLLKIPRLTIIKISE